MACPGSVRLSAELPPSIPSAHAAEGTAAHSLAERCLREGTTAAAVHIGEEINGFPVDDDMAAAVQVYLDHVHALKAELELTHDLKGVEIEKRLDLSFVRSGMFGTADTILDARVNNGLDGELIVVDYKHGRGVEVAAEDNPQLQYYGLGALGPPMKTLKGQVTELVNVRVIVVQPRCGGGDAIRDAKYTSIDLRRWGDKQLGPAADAARKPDAPLVPGDEQCRWCPAKATCPALRDHVALEAAIDFGAAPVVVGPKALAIPEPKAVKASVASVEIERLSRILAATPLIEAWLKAVGDEAERRALAGEAVPGFKLVESITRRRWKYGDEDTATRLRKLGIDPWAPPSLLGVPGAEKALGAAAKGDAFLELVEKPLGGPTLVPESDRRSEWISPEQEFAAVSDTPGKGDHDPRFDVTGCVEVDNRARPQGIDPITQFRMSAAIRDAEKLTDAERLAKHGPQGGDPMGGPLQDDTKKTRKPRGPKASSLFDPLG
jgi:hypothetical protein